MASLGYIQVVRICNQTCRFCSNPENGRELPLADAKRLVDDFKERGFDGVIITGGEPTLYPHLAELIRYTDTRDMPSRLITNGQTTADRPYLLSLVNAGLRHINVSVHSHKPAVQAFISGNRDSLANTVRTLHHLARLPVTVDLNQTVCAHNADHVDETIRWLCERFPHIRHVSWTYLDPYMNRVAENPDVVPRLRDSERAVLAAMRYLQASGRSFRMEKLPLCYMGEFAHCSTETRKLVKNEAIAIEFLDERARVDQGMWYYGKALTCKTCTLEPICAGLWDIENSYDPAELRPQTNDPQAVIDKILKDEE